MNFIHALMEINTIILLLCYTNVSTGSERLVLFFYLLNGGDLAETEHILVCTIAEL